MYMRACKGKQFIVQYTVKSFLNFSLKKILIFNCCLDYMITALLVLMFLMEKICCTFTTISKMDPFLRL